MRTVAALWQRAVEEGRAYPAFLVEEAGAWRPIDWDDAATAVDELSTGLLALGIGKGDRVAIMGRTRLEWTLCDYALAQIGGVTVPIYPTSSTLECAYILGNAAARAIVCEGPEHYAKVAPIRAELEALDLLVSIDEVPAGAMTLGELRERGRAYAAEHPDELAERRAGVGEDDVLTIIYTSGTTGPPKGCVLTQRHYAVMVEMVRGVPGLFARHDRVLLYLPLAHNIARLVQYAGAGVGFTLAYCPEIADVPNALVAVRPTIFPSVPRLFEKVHAGVETAFAEATGLRRTLVSWALSAGGRGASARASGQPVPPGLAAQLRLADRLVFSKVKRRLGGSLRIAISGGAPLSPDVAEFFDRIGILILEGYGLTECTTASHLNRPDRVRFGTVGLPLPGVEARIGADGEVLLRGENVFLGYYGDEKATREAFTDEGWLKTGDVGSIDADGFLTITDRKKDIIVTAGAKNISPQNIESALQASGYVSQALVIGDRRPYLVALLALDRERIEKVERDGGDVRALAEKLVSDVNRDLARPAQIKRFAILDREFEAERGEVTPTLKLRRQVCAEHFREEIERLYSDETTPARGPAG